MGNLYKDADKRRKVIPGGAEKPQEPSKAEVGETPARTAENPVSEAVEPSKAIVDLLGTIGEERKPVRKSASLYLSETNLQELKKRAKASKLSASEYLDQLLAKLFFG